MADGATYIIIETRYQPSKRTKLDFSGDLAKAKKKAIEKAKANIGVRYVVFREDSQVAEFQAYYRTTVKCPKCGEVIPIE